jgi:hypothetical protein
LIVLNVLKTGQVCASLLLEVGRTDWTNLTGAFRKTPQNWCYIMSEEQIWAKEKLIGIL